MLCRALNPGHDACETQYDPAHLLYSALGLGGFLLCFKLALKATTGPHAGCVWEPCPLQAIYISRSSYSTRRPLSVVSCVSPRMRLFGVSPRRLDSAPVALGSL